MTTKITASTQDHSAARRAPATGEADDGGTLAEVSQAAVEKVARLAQLALRPDEIEPLTQELNQIVGFFRQLSLIDTSKVKPMSHVLQVTNVMREDKVVSELEREELLAAAPDRKGFLFKVPLVIES